LTPVARDANGTLADIAYARSGDKGIHANIGVIARNASHYEWLERALTAQRVADHLRVHGDDVVRYALPNLAALNFVIRGILNHPLRIDAQGKALGEVLLRMPLQEVPTGE
jgi:hypothetical protein